MPAAIVVTTASDTVDAGDGVMSLREAMTQANSNDDSDAITFDASLNGTEIDLTGGEMSITNNVTITGNGEASTIIDAQQSSRIFTVDGTGGTKSVTISSLTLKNGHATGDGGAIVNREHLLLSNCTITGNSAAESGGAVTTNATVSISNCTVTSNSASGGGGALTGNGTYLLSGSTFSSNSASEGGVLYGNGAYTANDCTFSSNAAGSSGGVVSINSSFTATSCLFANNSAVVGGVMASTGTLSLTNSTFSGNTVTDSGAVVYSNSTVSMTNCTVTNNRSDSDGVNFTLGGAVTMFQSATVTLKNTIIAGNFKGTGSTASDLTGSASSSSSYNLIGDSSSAGGLTNGVNGNQVGVSPLLGSLANNGGTSMTHALLTGSPAINAGSNTLVPGSVTTDQRGSGFDRFFGTFVDIGAFESQTFAQAVQITPDDTFTNTATITFAFQFNEDVTGFTAEDMSLTNGTAGTFTAVDARNYTLVVTPVADGVVGAAINANVVNEGNPSASASVTSDHVTPTLTISPNGTSTRFGITFTFQFSESVTGFSSADIILSQGTLGSVTTVDADTYTLFVSSSGLSNGPVTVTVTDNTITDLAGNANTAGATATVTFDNVAPTVTITPNSGTTSANPITFTFQFNEAVSGFTTSDVTVTNGTKGIVTFVDADTYTLNVTPTTDGTVTVTVGTNSTTDAAGNGVASTSASVTFEQTPPSLTITPNTGTTNANPITFTFQFTEAVTGFDETDISITNGTKGPFSAVDGDTYTLLVTPTASGTVTASVPANAAQDGGGNNNAAASASVTSDITAPTLAITPNGTTSNGSTITFTFQFSEIVAGFVIGDISVTNGTKGTFSTVDGDTYTLVVTPMADGEVTVNVDDNATNDAATNGNAAASATLTSDRTGPVFSSAAEIPSDENQTGIATVTASDPSGAVTFSLNGGADAGKFSITSDGVLTFAVTPNHESPTDDGIDNVYDVIVRAIDSLGNSTNQSIAVTVADMNEFNPVLNNATFSIVENSANDTAVGAVTANDDDATKNFEYTLTGNPLDIFSIDRHTGAITVTSNTNLDREQAASVVLTVEVTDNGPGTQRTDTAQVTISINGLNDNSPVFASSSSPNVAENSTAVGTVVATDADLPTQTMTYTITGGADAAKFNLTTSGVLTFKAVPNFESPTDVGTNNGYELSVTANDGNGNTTTQAITVNVADVNEFTPVLNDATFSIAENSANSSIVGTLTATDGDGSKTLAYSITAGNMLGIFAIDASTGAITVASNTNLDREQIASVVLTVQVSDGGPGTPRLDTAQVTINVTAVNDNAPVFTSDSTISIPQTTRFVTTVVATDADIPAQTVTYSISGGDDAAKFTIDATTGELSFLSAPLFATPADANTDNVYEVTVTANDGNGGTTTQEIEAAITAGSNYDRIVVHFNSVTNITIERILLGNQTTTQTLVGTTPITLEDRTAYFEFMLPATNDSVVFSNGAANDGRMQFTGTSLRTVIFITIQSQTQSLTVYGNDGNDSIKVVSLDTASLYGIVLRGGFGNDTLDTSALSNATASVLIGEAGNDHLKGSSGDDVLAGGAGNDTLSGGGGTDQVVEDLSGIATLSGSALKSSLGNDSLSGIEKVLLMGSSVADRFDASAVPATMSVTLYGTDGNDTLIGGAGSDLLNGGDGLDSLTGGAGTDSLVGGADLDRVVESGNFHFELVDGSLTTTGTGGSIDSLDSIETAFLTGGSGNNVVTAIDFTLGPVTLFGGSGNDTLNGSTQGDLLNGGAGTDLLNGHAGDDSLTGEAGNDTFDGGANTDRIVELGDVTLTIAAAGLTGLGTDTFTNIEEAALTGGKGNNALTVNGFAGKVTLAGAAGKDTLTGSANNDSLDGGDGSDRLILTGVDQMTLTDTTLAGQGNDVIVSIESATITTILGSATTTINTSSFSGNVTVTGSNGDDAITTGGGNDSILGGLGNDELHGGFGLDTIDGGAGNDCIHGDAGSDKLLGGIGNDTILGGIDNDSIDGGADDDVLLGEVGNDTLFGGKGDLATDPIGSLGDDILSGGEGNDSLSGGDGADTILGGAGTDKLAGGNGNDLLSGDADKDTLAGDGGTDTLFGGLDAIVDSLTSGETNNQELDFTDETFFTHLDELLAACE